MRSQKFFVALFVSLATALPPPAESSTNVIQGTATSGAVDATKGELAQKSWQAAGGCKIDWDEDNRCLSQCIGEANSKCVGWHHMTSVLTGGCVWGWHTCECVCEY